MIAEIKLQYIGRVRQTQKSSGERSIRVSRGSWEERLSQRHKNLGAGMRSMQVEKNRHWRSLSPPKEQ